VRRRSSVVRAGVEAGEGNAEVKESWSVRKVWMTAIGGPIAWPAVTCADKRVFFAPAFPAAHHGMALEVFGRTKGKAAIPTCSVKVLVTVRE
jgi:hypothetical protein